MLGRKERKKEREIDRVRETPINDKERVGQRDKDGDKLVTEESRESETEKDKKTDRDRDIQVEIE